MPLPESPPTLVCATLNEGKLAEFRALLEPLGYAVRGQKEFDLAATLEDGRTFVSNALLKARNVAASLAEQGSKTQVVADDSGLSVDALAGAPGIYSARFAGAEASDSENRALLLQKLTGLEAKSRTAHFFCALALVRAGDDPAPLVATGVWHGHISTRERGYSGFGYDSVFCGLGQQLTAAEMTREAKNRVSHRGQALKMLCGLLGESPCGRRA